MRSCKLTILPLLAFLLLFTPASAQDPLPSDVTGIPARATVTGSLENKRKNLEEKLKEQGSTDKIREVININDRLDSLNETGAARINEFLDRLAMILERLNFKIESADTSGLDTESTRAAYLEAMSLLTDARAAAANQSSRTYIIEASGPAGLKASVGRTVSGLQADLRAVRKLAIQAKQGVMSTVRELARAGAGKIGQKDSDTASKPAMMQPLLGD